MLTAMVAIAATVASAQTRDRSAPATTRAPGAMPARQAPAANEFATRFAVISQQNMFVRERIRRPDPSASGSSTRPQQPPATPESVHVLRGVVLEDGSFRAYFENVQAGQIVQVNAGDAIARGHVVEISIDAVAFEHQGAVVWVKVGDNLTGAQVAAGPAAGSAGSAMPGAAPPANADPSTLSAEERMRQRRMQRMGGSQ